MHDPGRDCDAPPAVTRLPVSTLTGLAAQARVVAADLLRNARGLGLRAFAKNATTYSAGMLISQLIGFAVMPFVTRMYGTAPFGVFSVFTSIVSTLAPIACLRLDFAIPLPVSRRVALALTQAASISTLAFCLLLVVPVLIIGSPVATRLFGEVGTYLWLLPFVLAPPALQLVFTGWNVREGAFRILSFSQVITALLGYLSQLAGGFLAAGSLGLIVGIAIGQWAGVAVQGVSWAKALCRKHLPSLRLMLRSASVYKPFLIWTLPSSVVNTLGLQLVPIIVVALYGVQSGGLFFLAYRIISLPTSLIGTSMSRVMWGEVAKMQRDDPRKLRPLFLSVSLGIFLMIAPGLLFLPFCREIFAFVLGHQWGDAGVLAAILFFSAWTGIAATTGSKLSVYGYNHWQTGWEIMRLAVTLAIGGAAAMLHVSLVVFTVAISAGWSLAYFVLFGLNLLAISRVERGERGLLPMV